LPMRQISSRAWARAMACFPANSRGHKARCWQPSCDSRGARFLSRPGWRIPTRDQRPGGTKSQFPLASSANENHASKSLFKLTT
jgi:hypothetical protein